MKNAPEEDLYIAMLRYGKENLTKQVIPAVTKQFLEQQGHEFTEGHFMRLFFEAFEPSGASPSTIQLSFAQGTPHVLTQAAYFNLIEHDQLADARDSSRRAMKMAIAAIAVSALFAFVSVGLQVIDTNIVRLDGDQLAKLLAVGEGLSQ